MTQPNEVASLDYELIETDERLKSLTGQLKNASIVALDTEADSFHHYRPQVCLIQVTLEGKTFIVDPLADISLAGFLKELSHKELIIHDAGYDLRMLKASFGFKPKNGVFDTMLAAALSGLPNVGLSALLERVLDMKVAKHNQRADWSKRPLTGHLLQYAAEDTIFLAQIREYLEAKLQKLGRMDWHAESCRQAIAAADIDKEPTDPENEWRIKGTGTLSFKVMGFVRELWYWREAIAKKTNIAPFMICRNADIIKLADWASRKKNTIDSTRHFPVRCHSSNQQTLLATLQTAQELPKEKWPGPRKSDRSKRLSKTIRNTVNDLKAECEKIADEVGLDMQWVASRAALTRVVLDNATTTEQIQKKKILMNWQANLLLPAIQKVLTD
ncbi:MAG: ribonuclease D [Anaerohalosphaeraceae bacterium]|jgi:ribonuclease D